MKKTIHFKNLIIIAFLFVFVLSLVLPIVSAIPTLHVPLKANAENVDKIDTSKLNRNDENYEWVNGASIYAGAEVEDLRKMKFRFEIINPDIFRLNKKDDYATYEFTVYRGSDEDATPIYQIGILSYYDYYLVGHKRIAFENVEVDSTFRPGDIDFLPDMTASDKASAVINADNYKKSGDESRQLYEKAKLTMKAEIDYTLDYVIIKKSNYTSEPFFAAKEDKVPYLDVMLTVNSPAMEYFITAKSQVRWYERLKNVGEWWQWLTGTIRLVAVYSGEEYDSIVKSPTRSIKGVLEAMKNAGALEQQLPTEALREKALEIITGTTNQDVTVSYLKQIEDTPLAEKITKTINVPVTNTTIHYDDVSAAIGESLNCLGASVNGFKRDSYGKYTAEYLSSVRVEAKTADGARTDYFLKLGQSFKDFYSSIDSEGAFNDGLGDYMLNEIKKKFPAAESYKDTTLYGLWGYVVVPTTTGFNSLFKNIFQVPTELSGMGFFDYSIKGNLSVDTYTTLLREHGYSWLQTIWQTAFTGVTSGFKLQATHYLFQGDPKISEINIGENGGELGDESGAIQEKLSEVAKEAINAATKATEDAMRTVRMIIATILIVSIGFSIAYGIIRLKKYNNE